MGLTDTAKQAAHKVGAHKISVSRSDRTVRVTGPDGTVLAETSRPLALEETNIGTRYYLPREDVRMDLLTPTDTTSHCPFKGDATYFSAPGAEDAFWVYEDPTEEDAKPVKGYLAPWPGRVTVDVS